MKAALIVNRVLPDRKPKVSVNEVNHKTRSLVSEANIDANLTTILNMANEAADAGADLVVFPEAALTGLINNDEPSHDLPLGQVIPGPVTDVLARLACERHIWLAIGLLEREGDRLYDSAVLLTPDGEIGLKYRRIHPKWHGPADPSVYCQGTELSKVNTPLGTFAFLICGDLFDDELIQRVRNLRPDWLLHLIARCFLDETYDQERWDREEKPEYVKRVRRMGTIMLMTNYLTDKDFDSYFGGAMVVSGDGIVMDSFPLGKVGILLVNL